MLYISFLAHNLSDSYRNLIQISSGIFIFAVEFPQNILQPFWHSILNSRHEG